MQVPIFVPRVPYILHALIGRLDLRYLGSMHRPARGGGWRTGGVEAAHFLHGYCLFNQQFPTFQLHVLLKNRGYHGSTAHAVYTIPPPDIGMVIGDVCGGSWQKGLPDYGS